MSRDSLAKRRERRQSIASAAKDPEALQEADTLHGLGSHEWPLRPELLKDAPAPQRAGHQRWREAVGMQFREGPTLRAPLRHLCGCVLGPGQCFSKLDEGGQDARASCAAKRANGNAAEVV